MTVPVQVPFSSSTASGSTTVFPFNFKIAAAADLSVTLDGVLQTTGYTVSGVGETAGGDVTFLVAPPNGTKVVRFLNPVLNRSVDYQQFGDWNSPVVNLDFDRLWLAMQMLNQNTNRSLKLPVDTAENQEITESPVARANKGIKFDSDGNLTVSDYDPDEAQTASAVNVAAAQLAADAAAAAMSAFDGESILPIEFGGTGADTAAGARTALGLGSAAVKTAGTGAGEVLLLAEANKLPALNGENLTGVKAPACQGAMKNFLMSATGTNANVSVSFDELVIGDGANGYFTDRNVSDTINTALTGAGGLDTGALAINTFYSVWRIRKADGTRSWLLSLSATAPTMPTGYVQKARVGWIRTDGTANKYPLSFKQAGRKVRYVVAAGSNVTGYPQLGSGSAGSTTTPTWVSLSTSAVVPSTAQYLYGLVNGSSGYNIMAAPNNAFGAYNSASNPPPVYSGSNVTPFEMMVESSNIYWANNGGGQIYCSGWEDNL